MNNPVRNISTTKPLICFPLVFFFEPAKNHPVDQSKDTAVDDVVLCQSHEMLAAFTEFERSREGIITFDLRIFCHHFTPWASHFL